MGRTQAPEEQSGSIRANKLALVERLADDLAHEIKNPLHSMVINLEVLRRRISRLEPGEQGDLLRYAGVLSGELDRVTRRVDLLLRLVRPERGAEPTTLAQTIEELLDLLEMERERHRVAIEFDPAPHPLRGHLPREAARQLALNLLLEALDRIPPGGTLTIRTETRDGHALLHMHARLPDGAEPTAGDPRSPRLAVAETIASAMSGRLELNGAAHGDAVAYALSIPLNTP